MLFILQSIMKGFMQKTVCLIFIMCLACLGISYGQFSDSVHNQISFTGTGNYSKTNTGTTYLLNNSLAYKLRMKKAELNSVSGWIYGSSGDGLTNNDFTSTMDFNIRKNTHRLYYWGLLNYTTSYSLKIKNQFQSGLGAAYKLWDEKTSWLNISDGFLFETSSIMESDTIRVNYSTFRNSLRLLFHYQFNKLVTLDANGMYQPSLEYGGDYLLNAGTKISIQLKSWLNLTSSLTYNKIGRTQKENFILAYGITVNNFF
ncbi:MAG: hypothetical protein DI598_08285 [Pseudopedobacter saltans]|uniref:DUF481 domain-containing protein n=1 Tax=Pseudopedobacter saltans TaxID=151895 RepID=A0A2W5EZ63_9SPHI|nr:MAG: hypothetical protein DI598_08285 [Pseudopedobacter saltans]